MKDAKIKRERMEQVAKRRFFYTQSFETYGGVSGFFDYGPHMCALQNNFLSIWRRHFVLEEGMQEIDTAIITPFDVLKTSGHVEKFSDLMCADRQTGEIYRADHLVKAWLEKAAEQKTGEEKEAYLQQATEIDTLGQEDMQKLIDACQIKSENGNELGPVSHFNLMFGTVVGPGKQQQSFLRPETAQGQFLNFKRLLEGNGDKMPFASAMVGKAFRNEISPRTGLFRVREFLMAEIEHFVHPEEKKHAKFAKYSGVQLPLLYRSRTAQSNAPQELQTVEIGKAVNEGIVNNETLGYYMARVYLFLVKIGIPSEAIRLRQHLPAEMAHYAVDCWDAEISTSYGWIECVGIADRACYDLNVHTKRTGDKLVARRRLAVPKKGERLVVCPDKKEVGKIFRSYTQKVLAMLEGLGQQEIEKKMVNNCVEIEEAGMKYAAPVETRVELQHVEEYTPSVIEPSFGVGRILYALLWHSFHVRKEDEQRTFFSFTPGMAPTKCYLLPLQEDPRFEVILQELREQLIEEGVSCHSDESKASIGRRYSRADEIGVPFCVTVDFDSLEDGCVTVRDRDSTEQIRMSVKDVPRYLSEKVSKSNR